MPRQTLNDIHSLHGCVNTTPTQQFLSRLRSSPLDCRDFRTCNFGFLVIAGFRVGKKRLRISLTSLYRSSTHLNAFSIGFYKCRCQTSICFVFVSSSMIKAHRYVMEKKTSHLFSGKIKVWNWFKSSWAEPLLFPFQGTFLARRFLDWSAICQPSWYKVTQ